MQDLTAIDLKVRAAWKLELFTQHAGQGRAGQGREREGELTAAVI